LTTQIKDVISKGILSDLPSVYGMRVEKALKRLFPDYAEVRIYSSLEQVLQAASRYGGQELQISDPVTSDRIGTLALWRPFYPDPDRLIGRSVPCEIVLPVIPFQMGGAPVALLFKKKLPPDFPGSEPVSPVLLTGMLRCLHDLQRYTLPSWFKPNLLQGCAGWTQKGIYVLAGGDPADYHALFQRFLAQGFLIAPEYPGPSILPAEASPGEVEKMIRLFSENPGK
jgi:hypothetical protein